jgi:16S rRNA (cytosine967-C5)-methyltransferase
LTEDSLAVAIEALSWMAYSGVGERTALLKASRQMNITGLGDLRQGHKWVMETSRFLNRLDWIISEVIPNRVTEDTPHGIRSLLRILAYVRFVDSKPTVVLERMAAWGRQIIGWRELHPYEECIARLASASTNPSTNFLPEVERLSVDTCHPTWYVRHLIRSFGRIFALRVLKRDLTPVANYARANELKTETGSSLGEQLHASKVGALDNVYLLNKLGGADTRAQLASTGKIVIQDFASIVAGLVASPKPNQTVLDVCASPGNKTSHLAAQMKNRGEIYSIELSQSRSLQWKREMVRTGCSIATLVRADARELPVRVQANLVLVDPPCSNSGVFARNPASKWRVTPGRLREQIRLQSEILEAASQRLTYGGTLIYCTCSILPEEDELVVEHFLKKNPDFTLSPQTPFFGCPGERGLTDCQRFYPHLHDCNGYFIAKMRKG